MGDNGYRYWDQTFSELFAPGAATRPFMIATIGLPYNLLVLAFAAAVGRAAPGRRAARIAGMMLAGYALAARLWRGPAVAESARAGWPIENPKREGALCAGRLEQVDAHRRK